jgi:DNA mismatch repair protein MutS2
MDPALVAAARSEVDPDELRADKLLDDIRKERNRTSHEREKLEKSRSRVETQARELEKQLEKIEDERRAVLARVRAEGEMEVAVLKQNIESLKQQLKKARQPLQVLKEIEEQADALQEKIESPIERKSSQSSVSGNQSMKLGERVFLASLNSEGIITALTESDAEVQIGTLRVRAKFSDLERKVGHKTVDDRLQTTASQSLSIVRGQSSSPGMEINLRGKLVEDGLDELDKYLEKAYSSGLPFVRIVHGKGTGKMREAVRIALKDSPYVISFEEPHENEGGAGVTIAKMANA